jgi:hypothetical protein
MSLSRRDFLKVSGLALATAWSEVNWAFDLRETSGAFVPVLQTWTNESTAQFRILNDNRLAFAYEFLDADGNKLSWNQLDHFVHPAWLTQSIDHLLVQGLQVGEDYRLRILDSQSGQLLDERIFSALDRSKNVGRTALISCMCDDFPDVQAEMWKIVADQNPDVVFLIGDATYLDGRDSDDEKGMWRRHLEVRRALDLYKWKRLRPVISVWDDHDYGTNDGGADYPLKIATRQMFEAMFGSQSESGLVRGPSLAQEASLFGQKFYLMDDRFYRTQNISNGSHWGEEQEEWLFSRMQNSTDPVFLMNGSQYFGGYSGYESFEKEHPEQFARVQKRLAAQAAPILFVSGDRHFSEAMKVEKNILGYETLELTSSSLHSYGSSELPKALNPRRFLATPEYNFILVDSSAEPGILNLDIKSLGLGGRVLFSHRTQIARNS